MLTKGTPEAAGWPQPAAAVYASGTPTPFISIFHRRSNSSSSACRIQSQNTENVNSSGRSRPPRRGRATTAHRSTNHRSSNRNPITTNANRTIGSCVDVTARALLYDAGFSPYTIEDFLGLPAQTAYGWLNTVAERDVTALGNALRSGRPSYLSPE